MGVEEVENFRDAKSVFIENKAKETEQVDSKIEDSVEEGSKETA
jgi:hypothetical protein